MRTYAWIVAACVGAALVVQPLVGVPSVLRLPALLVPALLVLVALAAPWRWDAAAWDRFDRWEPTVSQIRVGAAMAALVLFWILVTRFRAADTNAIDFGVYFDRPLVRTLEGHLLLVEITDRLDLWHRSLLAIHAYWVMLPLALLYAIHATPYWLLAVSAITFGLGAAHVCRIMLRLDGGGALAVASGCAFILNANTARGVMYGFHPELLYAWFIPAALDYGLARSPRRFLLAALACVAVKEDAFLVLLAISTALVLQQRRTMTFRQFVLYACAPPLIGLANLIVYYREIVPAITWGGVPGYSYYWTNYGATPLRAAVGMARHPLQVGAALLTGGFYRVLLPHAFLPLIGWSWSIGVLPIAALYSASTNPQLRDFGIYYSIPFVPFLVVGGSAGALASAKRLFATARTARIAAAGVVLLAALCVYGDRAGYVQRPWKAEVSATARVMSRLEREPLVLVQSGLFPHAGYDLRVQLLTPETLNGEQYAGAVLLLAPRVDAYPFRRGDLTQAMSFRPVLPPDDGVIVVRRP